MMRYFILIGILLGFLNPSHIGFAQVNDMRGIATIEWSPDDSQLAIIYDFGYLQIVDSVTQQINLSLRLSESALRSSLAWSPDGNRIAIPVGDQLKTVDVATGEVSTLLIDSCDTPHEYNGYKSVAWSPDGTKVVVGNECNMAGFYNSALQVWAVATAELLLSCRLGPDCDVGHQVAPFQIDWSTDGSQIVSASVDRVIVWDAITLEPLHFLTSQEDSRVLSMAVSPNDAYIAVGLSFLNAPYELDIWDAATGLRIHSFPFRTKLNQPLAWNENNSSLIAIAAPSSASVDYMIRLFEIHTGEIVTVRDATNVSVVSWSHNGEYIAYNISYFPEERQDSIEFISLFDSTTILPASPTP